MRSPIRQIPVTRADSRVLIAGAGPVGLVLALSLARRGHRVTVVEKLVDVLDQVRRAGTIHAATLEMLDDIGLYDRLEPRGLVAPLVHYWDRGDPEPIAVFDHAVLAGDARFAHALQCDRLKLIEEALKMASDTDLIEVRVGTELVGFEQDGDSVTAVTETADGERQVLRGTHLVGCEGAHSVVRKQLGIEFEGFAFPDRTMTLSVVFDFDSLQPYGLRNYILDPVEWANLFRWTDFWRVVLPADVDADPDSLLDDDVIEAGLQRFHPIGEPYEVVSKSLYTVHQRVAATFRQGRVLLAGDAAHVNSPIGAMGMNSGIHDAVNLAAKLSSVLRGDTADEVLDRYVRQRRHVAVAHVQAITIRNKKLMAEADPDTRRRNRDELRRAADDPVLAREFLLRASLISSVREATEIR
ncbi:MAG: FAD-binding monooxygenase [Acidimicrobiaceae bacterium]|nr:FAD-binding monooxygenase [Acidimicrobiaceae bacterium]MYE09275.1 FAD-binding monooxygenase [Acidimicrobiaceae bacterium]MYI35239.1 FAD-binding monooxygenase [Acidimicrobiaceae bacterium]